MKKEIGIGSKNEGRHITLLRTAICLAVTLLIMCIPMKNVYAGLSVSSWQTVSEDYVATNADRETAYIILIEHINSLKAMYDLSDGAIERMNAVAYEANVYIADTTMTFLQLQEYVEGVKTKLTQSVGDAALVTSTKDFLYLSNDMGVSSGVYGKTCSVTLSVVNFGKEEISDVIITPAVSTNPKEWPFVIRTASDARIIPNIPASGSVEESALAKRDVTWSFLVSDQALSGVYPIAFDVKYYRNGNIEEGKLVSYVNITGAPGNGKLSEISSETGKGSTPRIIVTGFKTDPENVFAGDTFNLTINVQNTSSTTAVSNIQFDIKADNASGADKTESGYEAFLPTSGSSTVYVDSIEPGAETSLSIEMTARNDLAQKPYVVELAAAYEDDANNPFTAQANVSIPVNQKARIEMSEPEILPGAIGIGESSNVMFSIYNLGKTTLYNVKVAFEDGLVSGGGAFIGKIDPGATGEVDTMLNGVMPNDDTGIVTATVYYEDESGNISSIEKEINLSIYEMDYGDMGEYMGDDMYMEGDMEGMEGSGMPVWLIIIIIVGGVAIVGVAVLFILKKRKASVAAKREREALEEELAREITEENAMENEADNDSQDGDN